VATPGSVLVVCTGNVCRSPYIERRLRHELAGSGIEVSSAGTRALVGRDMDAGTRELLQHSGIYVEGFTARELTAELVSGADLVVAAAREHRAAAARLHPAAMRRTFTLRDLADLLSGVSAGELGAPACGVSWARHVAETASRRRAEVPARQHGVDLTDPIGGPPSVFAQMAAEVDDSLVPVVRALRMVGGASRQAAASRQLRCARPAFARAGSPHPREPRTSTTRRRPQSSTAPG
jgi:protein-tyrosine phosphatase